MEEEKAKSNSFRSLYNKAKLLSELLNGVEIGNGLTFNGYRLGLLHDIRAQADKKGDMKFSKLMISPSGEVFIEKISRKNYYK